MPSVLLPRAGARPVQTAPTDRPTPPPSDVWLRGGLHPLALGSQFRSGSHRR